MTHQNDDTRDLRDLFAGLALLGLITEPPWNEGGSVLANILGQEVDDTNIPGRYACAAYALADAMIREREQ